MFSLRDYPLWFYKIFTLKDLQTIYPSNSYNLFREVAFSIRAGCFLFSSRLLSLFEQTIFTLQHTKSLKKRLKNKQKPTTFLQVKSTTFLQASSQPSNKQSSQPSNKQKPTAFNKQSPQPSYKQSPQPSTSKVHNLSTSKAHSHTTSLMLKKHSENKQILQNIPNILPFNIFLK